MPSYEAVAKEGDLAPGAGLRCRAGGRLIALFNVEGSYHALDDACLHRGGSLGTGEVEGCEVTCPLHGWRYDVRSGRLVTNPAMVVRTYPVRVEGGVVQVLV